MTSQDRLWTKDFIFITLENFFLFLTFFIFMTTLARYAMGTYAMTPGAAGFAVGIFVIGGLAGRLLQENTSKSSAGKGSFLPLSSST
jgi:hypothetical protein